MAGRKTKYVNILDTLNEKQEYLFQGNEKKYESYILENIKEICDILKLPNIKEIKRQQRFNLDGFSIIPDIVIYHQDRTVSIFEVKCSNPKYPSNITTEQTRAIGQMLLYKNVLEEILKTQIRVYLIDQKIHKRTFFIFGNHKLPITLIEIQNDRIFIPYDNAELVVM